MAEILRWRLLLFHDRDTVTNGDVSLKMDHIPSLLQTEYRLYRHILYQTLMLNTSRAQPMSARILQDQVNNDQVNWSFKDCSENTVLLKNTDSSLLRTIQQSRPLQRVTIDDSRKTSEDGRVWRESSMATYEAHVQDFLAALCVLIHISSGQPIREPEFFFMMWRNTQRRRHIAIRFSRVMSHTNYGRQQSQQGLYQDSVRFLAQPIGDLLLDYLVYVLPLRQRFARQSSTTGISSPLLWERNGKVWPDARLSSCICRIGARSPWPSSRPSSPETSIISTLMASMMMTRRS